MTCGNFDVALKMKSFRSAFKTHPQTMNIVGVLSDAFYFKKCPVGQGKNPNDMISFKGIWFPRFGRITTVDHKFKTK